MLVRPADIRYGARRPASNLRCRQYRRRDGRVAYDPQERVDVARNSPGTLNAGWNSPVAAFAIPAAKQVVCLFIVDDSFAHRIEADRPFQARRDVAEVRRGCRADRDLY